MSTQKSITFKVGSTFSIPITYTPNAPEAPVNLANVTVTSQVRTLDGALVANLAVSKDLDNLAFTVSAPDGTEDWCAGDNVEWDICFEDATGFKFYSETVLMRLARSATKAAT